jgi:hypothetical protein
MSATAASGACCAALCGSRRRQALIFQIPAAETLSLYQALSRALIFLTSGLKRFFAQSVEPPFRALRQQDCTPRTFKKIARFFFISSRGIDFAFSPTIYKSESKKNLFWSVRTTAKLSKIYH